MPHDRLLHLALDALGDHVTGLCLRLLRHADRLAALELCARIQEMYHSMIPHTLADEATDRLLSRIDELSPSIRRWTEEPWRDEVLQGLVSAVLHPAVTTIELSAAPEHIFPFGITWSFLVPLVCARLGSLHRLQVVRLGRTQCDAWTPDVLALPATLQEFAFIHTCSDRMLVQLASECRSLQRLNVRESRRVTDASVSAILQLPHLQELNIVGTRISESGLTRLLDGLHERACALHSFGCSYITYKQLRFLVTKFPELVEVILSHSGVFDLAPLGALARLRNLSFRSIKFGQIQDLLMEVGPRLVSLELRHIQSLDVRFIGQHCVALQCFHLFSYGVLQPPLEEFHRDPLPGFQALFCFQFDCDWHREWIDLILSQCTSVRKVDVTVHRKDTYLLLKHVLMRNPLQHLEKLFWSPSSPDGEIIAKQLAEQCPNLSEIRGLCKNKINYRGVHLS